MPKIKGNIDRGSVMATVPDTTGIAVGKRVSGQGIAPGTTVAEIRGPEAVQLSQGATDTVIGADLVFADVPKPAEVVNVEPFRVFDQDGDGKPGGSMPKAETAPVIGAAPATKPTTRKKK